MNASGGIGGRKIEIVQCNDQLSPTVAASCGRTAVSDGVAAVIEVESGYEPNTLAYLYPAGIPLLADNPSGPTELSDSDVFPIGAGSYGSFAGAGPALVKYGNCHKMAIVVLNLAATEISGNNIAYSFKQAGGTVVGIQAVSPTLPDYSTVVQTAIQQGADCISQVMGGSMEAGAHQGSRLEQQARHGRRRRQRLHPERVQQPQEVHERLHQHVPQTTSCR